MAIFNRMFLRRCQPSLIYVQRRGQHTQVTLLNHVVGNEVVLNKSRFIAHASPVTSSETARAFINSITSLSQHRKATTVAWAYRFRDGCERISDGGEPSGTAGRPILGALMRARITDAVVVVFRVYGGTKLGTSRLTRAFGDAAKSVIEKASIITIQRPIRVDGPLIAMNELIYALRDANDVRPVVIDNSKVIVTANVSDEILRIIRLRLADIADTTIAIIE